MAKQRSTENPCDARARMPRTRGVDFPTLGVILADGDRAVRESLALSLTELRIQPLSSIDDGLEAIEHVRLFLPDVAILGLEMPRCDGVEATRVVRALSPATRVLVTASAGKVDIAARALEFGASLVLRNDISTTELGNALARAVSTPVPRLSVHSSPAGSPAVPVPAAHEMADPDALSDPERDLLISIAAGANEQEAAAALGLSEDLLQKYVGSVFAKLRRRAARSETSATGEDATNHPTDLGRGDTTGSHRS